MITPRLDSSLNRLLSDDPPAFAIIYRPTVSGTRVVEILCGRTTAHTDLTDVSGRDEQEQGAATRQNEMLLLIPFRQVTERGFSTVDDGTDLIAMDVHTHTSIDLADMIAELPDIEVRIENGGFETDDAVYVQQVHEIINEEIGRGEGSNFVVKRSYTGQLANYDLGVALSLFRRLLKQETGAYWTFLINTGDRVLVGASPECHLSCENGLAVMNPISGTYRYPQSGPVVDELVEFLDDRKETDELNMVVDEELKMMACVCDKGAWVTGPFLKEMAHLAHAEYYIKGYTTRSSIDLLRATLFAPTVVGSPLANALRVITRRERTGRRYYGGTVALIGHDRSGRETLDSAILIRTAEVDEKGQIDISVGATLVRHSDADSEVAETKAKVAGLLGVLDDNSGPPPSGAPTTPDRRLRSLPTVAASLTARNSRLAPFWFVPDSQRRSDPPVFNEHRVLVLDAEDAFTSMLAHQLDSLGLDVTVRDIRDRLVDVDGPEQRHLVVLGPGPGDPRDAADSKIVRMREYVRTIRATGIPLLAVCLGHQMLCAHLGLDLVRLDRPNQGAQREIELFGKSQLVGFYNTFVATSRSDRFPAGGTELEVDRDYRTGHVHALRGPGVRSLQFHPESIFTRFGVDLLADCVRSLVPQRDRVRA